MSIQIREAHERLVLHTDVLIIGGGMSGAWAAIAARQAGAEVILVDKGYCGTSGVTATAGPTHWWVAPEQREAAVDARAIPTLGLADKSWMHRILAETWQQLPTLAPWYDFARNEQGQPIYAALRGPEYMRALRQRMLASGVRILDHSPALELLVRADGSVGGARGWQIRQQREWLIRSAGVILATGGCAFKSHLLGSGNNTGDGLLMAAEVGADLSGMEFSNAYCVAQGQTTMTRAMIYAFATYYDASGREIAPVREADPSVRTFDLATALLEGPVYCSLHRVPEDIRRQLAEISPNVPLLFNRARLDPYQQRFEVSLRAEGTIRGTGGLRIINKFCQTLVTGLYAIGDTATRELVAGANTGGGAVNAAWALSSGVWAGQALAQQALSQGRRLHETADGAGQMGLGSQTAAKNSGLSARLVAQVRDEMLPFDKNFFRTEVGLNQSLDRLETAWQEARQQLTGQGAEQVKAREAAALIASARWCYRSALARPESRGLHYRQDIPDSSEAYQYRLNTGGLDQLWVRPESAAGVPA